MLCKSVQSLLKRRQAWSRLRALICCLGLCSLRIALRQPNVIQTFKCLSENENGFENDRACTLYKANEANTVASLCYCTAGKKVRRFAFFSIEKHLRCLKIYHKLIWSLFSLSDLQWCPSMYEQLLLPPPPSMPNLSYLNKTRKMPEPKRIAYCKWFSEWNHKIRKVIHAIESVFFSLSSADADADALVCARCVYFYRQKTENSIGIVTPHFKFKQNAPHTSPHIGRVCSRV